MTVESHFASIINMLAVFVLVLEEFLLKRGNKKNINYHSILRIIFFLLVSPTLLIAQTADSDENPISDNIDGKVVRSIKIKVNDVFEGDDVGSFYRALNALKIGTKEHIIRQELKFDIGDTVNKFLLQESARQLRSLRYLRRIQFDNTVDGDFVDIVVSVQDTWTLIPQISFSSGDGRDKQAIGLADSDWLGYGKRAEVLFREETDRSSIEAVYDDRRVWGSEYQLLAGYFDRSDGGRSILEISKPFRSLVDTHGWIGRFDLSDTVGRLFANGDERFIFRQDITRVDFQYTKAYGDPSVERRRFSFGYDFQDLKFSQASRRDAEDLDLDPDEIETSSELLASNRRFSGPTFAYRKIVPDFVSLNYIDLFDRVEDFNLGRQSAFSFQIAPEFLGSNEDAFLFSTSFSEGLRFGVNSFARGEVAFSSRLTKDGFLDSLLHLEAKYYKRYGSLFLNSLYLGNHTLASSFFLDYGDRLDGDRELLIGGDNSIRGYEARTFTGDKRIAINFEDRVHLAENLLQIINLGAAFFVEVGGATNDNLGELITDNLFSDVGVGLRVSFPRSSGARVLRFDVAFPLRDGPDGSGSFEPRFLISAGQLFGADLRSERIGSERAGVDVGFDR